MAKWIFSITVVNNETNSYSGGAAMHIAQGSLTELGEKLAVEGLTVADQHTLTYPPRAPATASVEVSGDPEVLTLALMRLKFAVSFKVEEVV